LIGTSLKHILGPNVMRQVLLHWSVGKLIIVCPPLFLGFNMKHFGIAPQDGESLDQCPNKSMEKFEVLGLIQLFTSGSKLEIELLLVALQELHRQLILAAVFQMVA
ncbi:MAG: hypothetical protein EBR82_35360, partial [Caulobacteraceae bacterium]|nr:hypothetical protein [Caulobacteraceae bacterium]